ncbi:MAG: PRC-barrel domain-containing protein [Armatimonadetes bacterium]|nr:PRC-barrel domain-containing protein [Armatimonadota bacterium]
MREVSTVRGLEVVGIADGRVVGRVTQVICDLASGELLGLITGQGAAERGIRAEDIVTMGEDAVMIPSSQAARPLSELPELLNRRREPTAPPLEVVTDQGRRLGRVTKIWINPIDKKVTRYEVSAGVLKDLAEGPVILPVVPGSVHGLDTLVIPAVELANLAGHPGGLRAQLKLLSEKMKAQSAAAREKSQQAARAARESLEKAVAAAKEGTTAARERTLEAAKLARQKAEEAARLAREKAEEAARAARERLGHEAEPPSEAPGEPSAEPAEQEPQQQSDAQPEPQEQCELPTEPSTEGPCETRES